MFPGTEDSGVYEGIATKAEEEEAARRAAVSFLTALRQIDTRIANLTRRERKLTATVVELRTGLDATEDDLESARAELAAATAERGAIAARVAIPNAKDVNEFEQVADTSIQTLRRLGDLAGHSNAADALRGLLDQAAERVRILPAEATALANATAPALGASASGLSPEGIHIEYAEDQDMEGEEEIHAAMAVLQEELDTLGLDHSSQRVAVFRLSIRALKRPRKSGVAKHHLKGDKGRAAPCS